MYAMAPSLEFSLKIPRGVSDFLKGVAGAVIRGSTVTIPTPYGPQTFNLGDPAQVAQLEAMIRGTRLHVATPQPGGGGLMQTVEEKVPGGWVTIGAIALAGVFLISQFMRPRGR